MDFCKLKMEHIPLVDRSVTGGGDLLTSKASRQNVALIRLYPSLAGYKREKDQQWGKRSEKEPQDNCEVCN